MNKKTEDKYDYTIRQISKMIASGDLKELYSKYLSNCPIGFMTEQDLYDYLIKNNEIKRYKNIVDELETYLQRKYCEYVDMESDDAFVISLVLDTLRELKGSGE